MPLSTKMELHDTPTSKFAEIKAIKKLTKKKLKKKLTIKELTISETTESTSVASYLDLLFI